MISAVFTSIILFLSTSFSGSNNDREIACRELVEINVQSETQKKVWRSKADIPSVDINGKMLFYINTERVGKKVSLIITPAKKCAFKPNTKVIVAFSDNTSIVLQSKEDKKSHKLVLPIAQHNLTSILSRHILTLEFESYKGKYDVMLKSDQSSELTDVIECISL